MRIDVLTLFPDMFAGVLGASILKRAADPAVTPDPVRYCITDIRDHTADKHKRVDQPPYGGGPGMVMQCQPIWDAFRAVEAEESEVKPRRLVMTPQGRKLDQAWVEELAAEPRLLIIAGHYEGIDERFIDKLRADGGVEEVSVGDYVLSGGELPAMVLIDAVVRLLPGVLGHEDSAAQDSFSGPGRLLDCPHYTRPPEWEGMKVPGVLMSGDHAKIAAWRREQSERRTVERVSKPTGGGDGLLVIRPACKADVDDIDAIHRAAFPEDTEARLVKALRKRHDLVVSLVAEVGGQVVGHAALSPMQLVEQPAVRGFMGLAPIAVRPAFQGRGVGAALIRQSLREAGGLGARAVFVLGDPDYYERFGFTPAADAGFTSDYGNGPKFMLALLPGRDLPAEQAGLVRYAEAFRDVGL